MQKHVSMIQLVGYQRTSQCKTISAMFDCSIHIFGLMVILWALWLLVEWTMR